MKLPENPFILMSFVNMKLRDVYSDLDNLCEDYDATPEEVISKLKEAGFCYDEILRQFK